jgi:predicted RNA-binding protein with RPS1 domain
MTSFSGFGGQEQRAENRGRVLRMALIYTPIALVSLALTAVGIVNGFIPMMLIFGLVGALTGYQAWQYIKDLRAPPMEFQGEVVRKWHKGNLLLLFMPSYYIMVDGKVHTGTVTRVEDQGAFVRMHSGREGFVPRKELDSETTVTSATEMVRPGEQVKYKVRGMTIGGIYNLSCRKAEERALVGKIFTVSRVEYAMLLEQDEVRVTCYPHSATIERLERYDESEKGFVPATHGATF